MRHGLCIVHITTHPLVVGRHEVWGGVHINIKFGGVEREGAVLGVVTVAAGVVGVIIIILRVGEGVVDAGVDGHVDLVALHGGFELVDVVLDLVEVLAGLEGVAVDEGLEVGVEDVGDGVVHGFGLLV